jgi:SAM-dependent methyltransferase
VSHALTRAVIEPTCGIDTSQPVELADIGLGAPGRVDYRPSGWLDLGCILRRADVSEDDVFLDLGSGKGRVVLLAARYPFSRVVGVELSPQLTEIARRNVRNCRTRPRCGEIELVTADATAYRIPDDVSIVYMFNPFRGPVFDAAIARLIESVDRRPRTVRLIYRKPDDHDRLMRTGRFRLVRTIPGVRMTRLYVL